MRLIDADELKRTLAEFVSGELEACELLSRKDVETLIDDVATANSSEVVLAYIAGKIIDEREHVKMKLEANEKRIQELKTEIERMDEHKRRYALKEERWMGKKSIHDDCPYQDPKEW